MLPHPEHLRIIKLPGSFYSGKRKKNVVKIENKISNFHLFVYLAFNSFLLRLRRERSLSPYGALMLYKLFQPDWSQPQELHMQMLPEWTRHAWKKKPFVVAIQAPCGLRHLFFKCHPSLADVQHTAMLPPCQRSIWFPLLLTAGNKPPFFPLLNAGRNHFALAVYTTLGGLRVSRLGEGSSPLFYVTVVSPQQQGDPWPLSGDVQCFAGAQGGAACTLSPR